MKYFGIYNNSGDVQTALNEETLVNPYVALVSGALDYNSIQPQSANYIGEWSYNGEDTYTFQVLDDTYEYWEGGVGIATSELYFNGDLSHMTFELERHYDDGQGFDVWHMYIYPESSFSDGVDYEFLGEDNYTWTVDELKTSSAGDSDCLSVYFNGTDTFTFSDSSAPLSLNTINPEYPEGE